MKKILSIFIFTTLFSLNIFAEPTVHTYLQSASDLSDTTKLNNVKIVYDDSKRKSSDAYRELTAAEQSTYAGIVWDNNKNAAYFPGASSLGNNKRVQYYLDIIDGPLSEASAETGFTITFDAYIPSDCVMWGRLLDFNDGGWAKNGYDYDLNTKGHYFFLNGGSNAESHLRTVYTTKGNQVINGKNPEIVSVQTNYQSYHNAFHQYCLVVAPGGNTTLYVDNSPVSFLESNETIRTVLNEINKFTTYYIGYSYFPWDDCFKGWIRNIEIVGEAVKGTWDGSHYNYRINYNTGTQEKIPAEMNWQIPEKYPLPYDENAFFEGWYYDSQYNNKATPGDLVQRNITLYAKWNTHNHGTSDNNYTSWNTRNSLPTMPGKYVLVDNVTLTNSATLPSGLKLCLNGHSINGTVVIFNDNIEICNCETENSGSITQIQVSNGKTIKVGGKINTKITLGSNALIDITENITGSKIYVIPSKEGLITNGLKTYGGNPMLGQYIYVKLPDSSYGVIKTKSGEIKVIK